MKIIRQIVKQIQIEVSNNIVDINAGGCGRFALFMCKALQKKGYDVRMMLVTGDNSTYEYKRIQLEKYKKNIDCDIIKTSFSHCYLKLDDYVFDAEENSIEPIKSYYNRHQHKFGGEYSIEDMDIAVNNGGWNPSYDKRQDKQLIEIIRINTLTLKPVS